MDAPGEMTTHPKTAQPDRLSKAVGILNNGLVVGIDTDLVDMVTCVYLGDRRGRGKKDTFRCDAEL